MTALRTKHAPNRQTFRSRASTPRHPASTGSGNELASLCVGIAALGIAALSSAASSSLVASLNGTVGLATWWGWALTVGSVAWAGTALLYAFSTLRSGNPPLTGVAVRVVGLAAFIHLATVLIGLWSVPAESRYLDVTVASLVILELTIVALMGWRHNKDKRTPSGSTAGWKPSALAVTGTMFGVSILVASITTVGLAASTAGQLAVPHSGHGSGNSGGEPIPEQLKFSGHHH